MKNKSIPQIAFKSTINKEIIGQIQSNRQLQQERFISQCLEKSKLIASKIQAKGFDKIDPMANEMQLQIINKTIENLINQQKWIREDQEVNQHFKKNRKIGKKTLNYERSKVLTRESARQFFLNEKMFKEMEGIIQGTDSSADSLRQQYALRQQQISAFYPSEQEIIKGYLICGLGQNQPSGKPQPNKQPQSYDNQ